MVVGDEVEQVCVAARHRGAGVADVLMTEAERRVAGAGHATAWLAVVAGNTRARRFYERRGWADARPIARARGRRRPAGGPVPCYRYALSARPASSSSAGSSGA